MQDTQETGPCYAPLPQRPQSEEQTEGCLAGEQQWMLPSLQGHLSVGIEEKIFDYVEIITDDFPLISPHF